MCSFFLNEEMNFEDMSHVFLHQQTKILQNTYSKKKKKLFSTIHFQETDVVILVFIYFISYRSTTSIVFGIRKNSLYVSLQSGFLCFQCILSFQEKLVIISQIFGEHNSNSQQFRMLSTVR